MVDCIIVGQGLAGSAVAAEMLKRGKRIVVIDRISENNSSRIAAGMFNPVTGKNMVKTWMADVLFPYLHDYYRTIEKITGSRFFFPMPVYRPFKTIEQQNEWMARSADSNYQPYIDRIDLNPGAIKGIHDPLGGIWLKQSGYINTLVYIKAIRSWIRSSGVLLNQEFDDGELIVHPDYVEYQGYSSPHIIFCQGVRILQNRWFRDLPVKPLKGETITINGEGPKDVIISGGVYIVPLGGTEGWRVGSTYDYQDSHPGITDEALKNLREKLEQLWLFPYKVTAQDWGMRPTTPDRRPLIGRHPQFGNLIIFNGMGTKGVSLAPYFSSLLAGWLENDQTINKETDVSRFISKLNSSK